MGQYKSEVTKRKSLDHIETHTNENKYIYSAQKPPQKLSIVARQYSVNTDKSCVVSHKVMSKSKHQKIYFYGLKKHQHPSRHQHTATQPPPSPPKKVNMIHPPPYLVHQKVAVYNKLILHLSEGATFHKNNNAQLTTENYTQINK